jgi:hypothetical protein
MLVSVLCVSVLAHELGVSTGFTSTRYRSGRYMPPHRFTSSGPNMPPHRFTSSVICLWQLRLGYVCLCARARACACMHMCGACAGAHMHAGLLPCARLQPHAHAHNCMLYISCDPSLKRGQGGEAIAEAPSPAENGVAAGVSTPELATETPVRPRANGRGAYPRSPADTPSSSMEDSEGDGEGPTDFDLVVRQGGTPPGGGIETASPGFSGDDSGSGSEFEPGSESDEDPLPAQPRKQQGDAGWGSTDESDEDTEGEEGEESDGVGASDDEESDRAAALGDEESEECGGTVALEGDEGGGSDGVVASEDEDGGASGDPDSDVDHDHANAGGSDESDAEAGGSDDSDLEATPHATPPAASGAGAPATPAGSRRLRGRVAAQPPAGNPASGPRRAAEGRAGPGTRSAKGSGSVRASELEDGPDRQGRTLRSGRKRKSDGPGLGATLAAGSDAKGKKKTRKR